MEHPDFSILHLHFFPFESALKYAHACIFQERKEEWVNKWKGKGKKFVLSPRAHMRVIQVCDHCALIKEFELSSVGKF